MSPVCFRSLPNHADGAFSSNQGAKMYQVVLLCKEKSWTEKVKSKSWIVNIKIPMTVERKYPSSCCSWRVQCRGLGTMTQTSTVCKLNPDNSLHHHKAFSSTSSLKIRRNYLESVASADEFTCKQACLLQHNFPCCLNPCVVGKLLGQISFDRSRNTAFLNFCMSSKQTVCVHVCSCACAQRSRRPTVRGTESAGHKPRLSIMIGLNIEVGTPNSSTILDFPVYLRWRGITGGVSLLSS